MAMVGSPDRFAVDLPPGAWLAQRSTRDIDVAILFVRRRSELERRFASMMRRLALSGRLWVCWPKKSSDLDTDLDFDLVQRTGLAAGLVDNKSASITADFQGLQFVYRLKDRR